MLTFTIRIARIDDVPGKPDRKRVISAGINGQAATLAFEIAADDVGQYPLMQKRAVRIDEAVAKE